MAEWIIPCNPQYFDIFRAFEKLETIDWRQTAKTIETGDTVYIYVGLPVQAIAFKCRVQQTMIPPEKVDDSDAEFNLDDNDGLEPANIHMRLKLVKKYSPDEITIEKMRKHGLKGNIQGQRRAPDELKELFSAADKGETTEQESFETAVNKEVREKLKRQIREKETELSSLNMKRGMLQREIALLEEILWKITEPVEKLKEEPRCIAQKKDEHIIVVTEEEYEAHRELLEKLNNVVINMEKGAPYTWFRTRRFSGEIDLEEDL